MERSLSMELVRVTEAAALASARWMGRGKKDEADEAATSAMRDVFDTVPMKGTVVIGEGEMDEAPMLYIGEKLGNGYGPRVDVAVDPLEGTNILASGGWNALTVIAVADHGTLLNAPDMYMQKIAVGPEAVGCIDIEAPVIDNLKAVAKAKNKDVEDVVATILNRERHAKIISELREAGARIKLINDGDVAGAINTAFDHTGVDDMIVYGGVDVDELLKKTTTDRYKLIKEMIEFIDEQGIVEFKSLMDYAMKFKFDDWFPLLCDNSAYVIQEYIKSNRYKSDR